MKRIVFLILFLFVVISFDVSTNVVYADELTDNIEKELDNIDFSDMENFLSQYEDLNGFEFYPSLKKMLKGEYSTDFSSVFTYVFNVLLDSVYSYLSVFLSIIVICLICSSVMKLKSSFLSEEVSRAVNLVCFLCVAVILLTKLVALFKSVSEVIAGMGALSEYATPIILTLMVASGGTTSASLYQPAVAFFSDGIISIVCSLVLPMVSTLLVFLSLSGMTDTLKIDGFVNLITSALKWIFGLSFTVFGIFLGVQGIASATYDGVSLKAAKYAISNSIPIIGGFLKDGSELIMCGCVLIKNAVGVCVLIVLFYITLLPVLNIAAFSLCLKLTSALVGLFGDDKVGGLCQSASKCLTYLVASILLVGFMLFVTILLMLMSANGGWV